MIIFKIILFIISVVLIYQAIQEEDFDNLFLAIFLFVIALGIETVK